MGKARSLHATYKNEKQQITEPSVSTRPTGSLNFASTENAQFPHSVFYDFPSPFWIPAAAAFLFLRVSPVYFGELISPQSPDNGSAATAEVERKHGKSRLALKYLWFFSVVIVWVLTAMAHYCDPSPNKRPDVLLSVVTWRGEAECMLFHIKSPSFACFPLSSLCIKDISECFLYWSSSLSVFFLLLLSFATIFSKIILFKSLYSKECSSPLSAFSSLPSPSPISFPLPCHLCTTFIMADWWLPLQYRSVILKSPRLVPTNLQQADQVCLHTDCKLLHI